MLCLGLIGNPVAHSRSPEIYRRKFDEQQIQGKYSLFPLQDIHEISQLLKDHPEISGLNVTIPFKEKVIAYLDETDTVAATMGAVNTIVIRGKREKPILIGYNTDATGFEETLLPLINSSIKALLLGTGGSSRAVQYTLHKLDIPFTIVSRISTPGFSISYERVDQEVIQEHQLIINTTPLGMSPDTLSSPDLPYHLLTGRHILYDLVYSPEMTTFLLRGQSVGCRIINGTAMLHAQAEHSFRLFLKNME